MSWKADDSYRNQSGSELLLAPDGNPLLPRINFAFQYQRSEVPDFHASFWRPPVQTGPEYRNTAALPGHPADRPRISCLLQNAFHCRPLPDPFSVLFGNQPIPEDMLFHICNRYTAGTDPRSLPPVRRSQLTDDPYVQKNHYILPAASAW